MKQKLYQIDAFTNTIFSGNPAAVCPLEKWLSDDVLQKIAMENNLAETAFYVKDQEQFQLRWFTPTIEVDLCGHATLAAAYVLFQYENYPKDVIQFYSPRSGKLTVTKKGERLSLNFPTDAIEQVSLSGDILACFDIKPQFAFKGKTDLMLVFDREETVKNLIPKLEKITKLPARGVIVTAKGNDVDFVSRFFAPQSGIDEDPVTGSAHTTLTPYWAKQLHKTELSTLQLSPRQGELQCTYLNDRVEINGQAKLYLIGEIYLE